MTNNYALPHHQDNHQIGRNGAHPNSPYGDPNGWLYGDGQLTYKTPFAARGFEVEDFFEEAFRVYWKWLKVILIVGGVFLLFGDSQMMIAMFKVMGWGSFVVLPYLLVKTMNRFDIYELN